MFQLLRKHRFIEKIQLSGLNLKVRMKVRMILTVVVPELSWNPFALL